MSESISCNEWELNLSSIPVTVKSEGTPSQSSSVMEEFILPYLPAPFHTATASRNYLKEC